MQQMTTLSAESIAKLDAGRVGTAINQAIAQAVMDCLDRPSDERKRKVQIELEIIPISRMDEGRGRYVCEGTKALARVKLGVPVRESNALSFGVNKVDRALYFNEDSPGNVQQQTFDFEDGKSEGAGE